MEKKKSDVNKLKMIYMNMAAQHEVLKAPFTNLLVEEVKRNGARG